MHQFNCRSSGGKIVPLDDFKQKFFTKLLNHYEQLGMNFKVTIEILSKDVNTNQISLYNAFIIRASQHFGNTFEEMQNELMRFFPLDIELNKKPVEKWNSKELNDFIDKANALLLEADSDFKF